MLKYVIVVFSTLGIAGATYSEYLDSEIEHDTSSNVISQMPYFYRDGYKNRVLKSEPSSSYVTLVESAHPKPELASSSTSLVGNFVSRALGYVSSGLSFLIRNFLPLILGSTAALGICKLTSLCSQGTTLRQLQREIRSLATPQRLKRATEFVESAIRKYNAMQ